MDFQSVSNGSVGEIYYSSRGPSYLSVVLLVVSNNIDIILNALSTTQSEICSLCQRLLKKENGRNLQFKWSLMWELESKYVWELVVPE